MISEHKSKTESATVLYEGSTAVSSATLSQSIEGFRRIEIVCVNADGYYVSATIIKISSDTYANTTLWGGSATGSNPVIFYGKSVRIKISGSSLSMDREAEINIKNATSATVTTSSTITHRLISVLAWKEL